MKRINNLYSQIYKTKNIFLADKRARKAKRNSYGVKKHDENQYMENFVLF